MSCDFEMKSNTTCKGWSEMKIVNEEFISYLFIGGRVLLTLDEPPAHLS
jgi:hypothetical protein